MLLAPGRLDVSAILPNSVGMLQSLSVLHGAISPRFGLCFGSSEVVDLSVLADHMDCSFFLPGWSSDFPV
jgi:hypothetical protein